MTPRAENHRQSNRSDTRVRAMHDKEACRHGVVDLNKLSKLYDLIVVGGGPAGVTGAIKAAQMGRRTIIIDRPKAAPLANGLDIFFGAPTGLFSKALRDVAKNINIQALRVQGLDDKVIWKQVQDAVGRLSIRNAEGQLALIQKLKIDYLQGEVTLLPKAHPLAWESEQELKYQTGRGKKTRSVLVKRATVLEDFPVEDVQVVVATENILLCTGSKAKRFPDIPFDGHRIFESDSINHLSFLPRSVVIAGSGTIAIEFANIFQNLGARVTMVVRGTLSDITARLGMDTNVAAELVRSLRGSGVQILENVIIDKFVKVPVPHEKGSVVMELSSGTIIESDIYLAALGRSANGIEEETGYKQVGIQVASTSGAIQLKNTTTLETNSPQIYAAGDVIGCPALASTSMEQASRAVELMFDPNKDCTQVPNQDDFAIGVWTIPEIAYYGLTKEGALARGFKAVEGIARYDECLRGRVFSPNGVLKLVFNSDNGSVLGVHIIGSNAAEMVHYGMSVVKSKTTMFDLMKTTFMAVTYHELFKIAALDANSRLEQLSKELPEKDDAGCLVKQSVDTMFPSKPVFEALDKDGNEQRDNDCCSMLFKNLCRSMCRRSICNLMNLFGDQNDKIDWEELQAIWQKIDSMV